MAADGSAGIGTHTEAMHLAGQHVLTVNEEIQSELRTLRTRLSGMPALWRGEAATRFQALMARWDGDAELLAGALRGIGEAVVASGVAYAGNEQAQRDGLSRIARALG